MSLWDDAKMLMSNMSMLDLFHFALGALCIFILFVLLGSNYATETGEWR